MECQAAIKKLDEECLMIEKWSRYDVKKKIQKNDDGVSPFLKKYNFQSKNLECQQGELFLKGNYQINFIL